MANDTHGKLLGIELHTVGSDVRMRLVYPTGCVHHTIPFGLFSDISRRERSLSSFLAKKSRVVKFGNWVGPE